MREAAPTISRLQYARSIIAGAAFLAGVVSAQAQQPGEETALAVPRLPPPDGGEVGLPQPLARSDARRVRQIFALQAIGEHTEAARITAQLDEPTLLGDILADRYLSLGYQASAAELAAWLKRYPELPDAPAIRAQLLLRDPATAPAAAPSDPTPIGDADASDIALPRRLWLDRAVQDRIRLDHVGDALRLVEKQHGLDRDYAAELKAEIARAVYLDGDDERALNIATHALHQSGGRVALAGFVGGLAAWRLDRADTAASLFEAAARAALAPPALRAAGAFWAARANLRLSRMTEARDWLRRAGAEPRTFYGLIARRMLGIGAEPADSQGADDTGVLAEADVAAIDATPAGHRAFALLQVGQDARADAALRQLWPGTPAGIGLTNSVLLVAQTAGLAALADDLADVLQASDGKPPRAPLPRLSPRGGFRVDPAIVYGLARLESNFDSAAISPAGARGLMQLMPIAVGAVSRTAIPAARLSDPALNLELGQSYLLYLARQDVVQGNLIKLLAAYNAGPASAGRWMDGIHDGGDPLAFIELIPLDETREYVRRALTYIWIYAARLGLPAPGLDELAAGLWPHLRASTHDLTMLGAHPHLTAHPP